MARLVQKASAFVEELSKGSGGDPMVLVDMAVPVPVVDDEAMGVFNTGGGVAGGGGGTEEETFVFPLKGLQGLEEVAGLKQVLVCMVFLGDLRGGVAVVVLE